MPKFSDISYCAQNVVSDIVKLFLFQRRLFFFGADDNTITLGLYNGNVGHGCYINYYMMVVVMVNDDDGDEDEGSGDIGFRDGHCITLMVVIMVLVPVSIMVVMMLVMMVVITIMVMHNGVLILQW